MKKFGDLPFVQAQPLLLLFQDQPFLDEAAGSQHLLFIPQPGDPASVIIGDNGFQAADIRRGKAGQLFFLYFFFKRLAEDL